MNARPMLLEVHDIHVRYGRISALKGVNLSAAKGEIVAVLGANGAGKTTLMRALAGLEPVFRGEVRFRSKAITRLPAHRRARMGIALVPEGRSVFAPLSVDQNLRLGLLPTGMFGKRRLFEVQRERVCEIFPVLKTKLRQRAGALSGGQQQMLAVARALMANPALLLLDEPSLGLAPIIVEELFERLLELNGSEGLTILLSEQNTENALIIADRGYVFEVGEVAVADTAEALQTRVDIEEIYLGRGTRK